MLHKVKEDKNALHAKNKRSDNWIGHILRRNRLLEHMIEGKIEGKIERTGREEEDVSSYWMTLRKLCKRQQYYVF